MALTSFHPFLPLLPLNLVSLPSLSFLTDPLLYSPVVAEVVESRVLSQLVVGKKASKLNV